LENVIGRLVNNAVVYKLYNIYAIHFVVY